MMCNAYNFAWHRPILLRHIYAWRTRWRKLSVLPPSSARICAACSAVRCICCESLHVYGLPRRRSVSIWNLFRNLQVFLQNLHQICPSEDLECKLITFRHDGRFRNQSADNAFHRLYSNDKKIRLFTTWEIKRNITSNTCLLGLVRVKAYPPPPHLADE